MPLVARCLNEQHGRRCCPCLLNREPQWHLSACARRRLFNLNKFNISVAQLPEDTFINVFINHFHLLLIFMLIRCDRVSFSSLFFSSLQIFPSEEPQPVQQPPRSVPTGHLRHSHAYRSQPQLQLPGVCPLLRGGHGQVSNNNNNTPAVAYHQCLSRPAIPAWQEQWTISQTNGVWSQSECRQST